MVQSAFVGFGNTDLLLNPQDLTPTISDNIQQTLSRLMAFYEAGLLFKALRCDVSGRLLVSQAEVAQSVVSQSAVTVTTSETTILPANVNRKKFLIQNLGSYDIYLYFTTGLAVTSALVLYAGSTFEDNSYVGIVYGKTSTGSANIRVVEY